MLSPRREPHMIGKPSSCSSIRRDWSSQLPSQSSPGAIRVIHIFAPKVIKTDVANFRALVQKLTGKTKRGCSASKNSKRRGASVLKTTSSMRSSTSSSSSFSSSSSSDATLSSSIDTTANLFSPSAAECSDSSTRCSNSSGSAPFSLSPDSSTTSSAAATVNRFYGLPSSFSPSQPLNQILPAEISAAFFRSQSYTTSPRSSDYNNCDQSSSSSAMVDPLQSLSGYKDNWSSQQASRSRRCSLNDESSETAHERVQSQSQTQGGPYSMSALNVTALNELPFSDMDITTGLVSLEPLPEFSLPPPLSNYNIMISNSIPAVTPDHFLLLNQRQQRQQEANVNCRRSVQSLLRGSVSSPFEHF